MDLIKRLRSLSEAARAMNSIVELDTLLDKILVLIAEVFSLDTCAVLLHEEGTGDLVIRRARGYDPDVVASFRGKLGQGITGWVAETGRPLLVPDVAGDPRYIGGVKGAVSEMAAPLVIDNRTIGVLDAESRRRDAFVSADLDLFAAFAANAATAVHNARMHEELARRAAQLEQRGKRMMLLNRVGQSLNSILEIDALLEEILRAAHDALEFERCAVLLREPHKKELVVRAARHYGRIVGMRIPMDQGLTGEVARSGKALLVADTARDGRYIPGELDVACEIAAPLVVRGEVIGVLDAGSSIKGAFNERDLELLSTFAAQAATAIHNADLFHNLEEANRLLAQRDKSPKN